ncbi:MAG: proline--tRNA ligase [Anaerolineales bacterium]|nr:proline--tRNA ligase [Anaerolineales bacterium]
MKMSQLFGTTLRDAPSEAEVESHRLLMRAGFIRPLGAGIFSYLHLARRAMTKIENILREEMDAIGGQEITMPVVHPADLWQQTGRWYQIGSEMGRFKDKNDHDMVLAMTHEEVVASLVRREVQSYKHLPRLIYHIQTKWRDDPRPRAGLIRVREFTMKDSYSLDADFDGLDRQYQAHYQAYFNVIHRCGLDCIAVKSDTGMMGGNLAHEYMYLAPIGEDTLLLCDACGYTANRQVARFRKPAAAAEEPLATQKVQTPACKSIEDLANFLGVEKARTAKAVFFMAEVPQEDGYAEKFVFAVVRGDMDLNETKLANAIQARELRPATEDEIKAVGAEPGFASPVGLKNTLVIVDDAIPDSPNLVAGANQVDAHLLNVNYERDYNADLITDIASADDGSACPECGGAMRLARGVELGNIFKLGTRYSDALGCTFVDRDGQERPVVMGSYGIGVGRLLACIAEQHHDEQGLVWPVTIAPFHVHLVLLRGKGSPQAEEMSDRLYADLRTAGIEVLYDERDESPGVKFNDADLIGLPIRLTVSDRALAQGGVECKLRNSPEKAILQVDETVAGVQDTLCSLQAEIAARLAPVEYNR